MAPRPPGSPSLSWGVQSRDSGWSRLFLSGVCVSSSVIRAPVSPPRDSTRDLKGWETGCPRGAWGRCLQASGGEKGAGCRVTGGAPLPPKDSDLTRTAGERPSAGELRASGGRRRPRKVPLAPGLGGGVCLPAGGHGPLPTAAPGPEDEEGGEEGGVSPTRKSGRAAGRSPSRTRLPCGAGAASPQDPPTRSLRDHRHAGESA